MNERDNIHVERIKEELIFMKKTLKGIDKDTFFQDDIIQHAMTMSLITIGECANHFSDTFKDKHNQIPWVKVIATRNIAVHGYWQLNMQQIWQTLELDIPQLCEFFEDF